MTEAHLHFGQQSTRRRWYTFGNGLLLRARKTWWLSRFFPILVLIMTSSSSRTENKMSWQNWGDRSFFRVRHGGRVKSKLGGIGNRFGDYSNRFAPVRWTHSIYKNLVHQTKIQNIEVYCYRLLEWRWQCRGRKRRRMMTRRKYFSRRNARTGIITSCMRYFVKCGS